MDEEEKKETGETPPAEETTEDKPEETSDSKPEESGPKPEDGPTFEARTDPTEDKPKEGGEEKKTDGPPPSSSAAGPSYKYDSKVSTEARDKMKELRDDELVDLVSLGGWLGGTEALASVLKENYTTEGSDLLNQIDLVKQLNSDFNSLSEPEELMMLTPSVEHKLCKKSGKVRQATGRRVARKARYDALNLKKKSRQTARYMGRKVKL